MTDKVFIDTNIIVYVTKKRWLSLAIFSLFYFIISRLPLEILIDLAAYFIAHQDVSGVQRLFLLGLQL